MERRFSMIVGAVGRTLIAFGLIVLLFAAYQLWGTGVLESREQNALEADFAERQEALRALGGGATTTQSPTTTVPTTGGDDERAVPTTTAPPSTLPVSIAPELAAELLPDRGESLGFIRMPTIGVDKAVVSGIGRGDLRKGPGHYPTTPLPGQAGNASIAGHRTTYGQPFHNLDLLKPGDTIEVETLQGVFYYEVMGHPNAEGDEIGHFIVDPGRTDVVEDQGDNRLTLTACHPKYSARERIIVTALMIGAPAPPIPTTTIAASTTPEQLAVDEAGASDADGGNTVGIEEASLDDSLGWHFEELGGTVLWAVVCLLLVGVGWLLGRFWRKWPAYAAVTPVFLIALFIAFGHLDRMLPAL